jgi:hypothetical protein
MPPSFLRNERVNRLIAPRRWALEDTVSLVALEAKSFLLVSLTLLMSHSSSHGYS